MLPTYLGTYFILSTKCSKCCSKFVCTCTPGIVSNSSIQKGGYINGMTHTPSTDTPVL